MTDDWGNDFGNDGGDDGPDDVFCPSDVPPPPEPTCSECLHRTAGDTCGFCGADLCPACFEMGGGFCSKTHTLEEIEAYEDALCGPPDEARLQQRKAKRELIARGILEGPK